MYGLDSEGIKSRLHGPFSASTYFEEACRLCDLDSGQGISTKAICLAGFTDTTNVLANLNAYPLFISLLNVREDHRKTAKAVRLAGLIPIIEGCSANRKSQILHQCIARVFSGFNDLHSEAKMRLCPDRRFRSTRLFLAFWAADLLEHWNLRCMIQGNCISCKCPKDRLGEIIPVDGDGQWRYPRYDSKEEKRRFQVAGDSAANMNI